MNKLENIQTIRENNLKLMQEAMGRLHPNHADALTQNEAWMVLATFSQNELLAIIGEYLHHSSELLEKINSKL